MAQIPSSAFSPSRGTLAVHLGSYRAVRPRSFNLVKNAQVLICCGPTPLGIPFGWPTRGSWPMLADNHRCWQHDGYGTFNLSEIGHTGDDKHVCMVWMWVGSDLD